MEFPLMQKTWKKGINTLDIVYPNLYSGGVYCLGPLLVYNIVNSYRDWVCKRVFLDRESITSQFIGFSLQWELDYYNVIAMIKKNNIPLSKDQRKQVIFAGGPVITANPEAFSNLFDFMVLGELEDCLPQILEHYSNNKEEFLNNIQHIEGVFIPGRKKTFSFVKNLDLAPYPYYQPLPINITKEFVFGQTFMLETERGCSFSCNFCTIPHYYNGLKFRSLKKIMEITEQGLALNKRNKVSIYAPAFIHPKRKEILSFLQNSKITYTLPSIRLEAIDRELLDIITSSGIQSITIAPETTEKLRKTLNKNFTDEQVFQFIGDANAANLKKIKLYFMLGLPKETEQDMQELVALAQKLKQEFKGQIYLSFNPYVSKKDTALQHPFNTHDIKKKVLYIKKHLQGIRYKITSVQLSKKEWELANANLLPLELSRAPGSALE